MSLRAARRTCVGCPGAGGTCTPSRTPHLAPHLAPTSAATAPAAAAEAPLPAAPPQPSADEARRDLRVVKEPGGAHRFLVTASKLPGLAAGAELLAVDGHSASTITQALLPCLRADGRSAGYLLARDMQRSGAATLLSQPTGGNLRGLNGGQLAWVNLPHSGVGVDIPLLAAFAPGDEPDGGVTPDLRVAPRWDNVMAGIDTELAAARRWLAGRRAAAR